MEQSESYWTEKAIEGFTMMLKAGVNPEELKVMFSWALSAHGVGQTEDVADLIDLARSRVTKPNLEKE